MTKRPPNPSFERTADKLRILCGALRGGRSTSTLDGMRKYVAISIIGIAALGWIARGWHQNATRATGFDMVTSGLSEQAAISLLGKPDRIEVPDRPFLVYASSPCAKPCQRRLWWESALLPSVEAWSVEIGPDGRVVSAAHWVSP
jgi:hypothetical protein